ncbi:MAG: glycosyltransferase [Glaciimonas sp.]|nr:glycosyltransferase [Glaciimonas sp.]
MYIVQFTHPNFLYSQSMPRFAEMIVDGMRKRGHHVDIWTARPFFYNFPVPTRFKKWLGYIDQFIIFPINVLWRLRKLSSNVFFVFSDQALGPWVPLVANRPHAIHVHDFMALRSALGDFPQNPTSWTGRRYQAFIRRGFNKGSCFLSVSENTRKELHHFLVNEPMLSKVIYNGLNFPFRPMSLIECEASFSTIGLAVPPSSFLLHVGGNQWYKNREGVLAIYEAYALQTKDPLPLWMVGAPPTLVMADSARRVAGKGDVKFLTGFSDEQVCAAYSCARLLIFPSLAEGFGWPIAEAMASGCLVLTTGEAPMTEVGGAASFYVPSKPVGDSGSWAVEVGSYVSEILNLMPDQVSNRKKLGYLQVKQFDADKTLDAYDRIYHRALAKYKL